MKGLKTMTALAMAGVMTLGVLAGCGGNTGSAQTEAQRAEKHRRLLAARVVRPVKAVPMDKAAQTDKMKPRTVRKVLPVKAGKRRPAVLLLNTQATLRKLRVRIWLWMRSQKTLSAFPILRSRFLCAATFNPLL